MVGITQDIIQLDSGATAAQEEDNDYVEPRAMVSVAKSIYINAPPGEARCDDECAASGSCHCVAMPTMVFQ